MLVRFTRLLEAKSFAAGVIRKSGMEKVIRYLYIGKGTLRRVEL